MVKKLALVLIIFTGASAVFAQDVDSVLTFKDAVQIALKNNVTLLTQRNNLMQSRSNKTYRWGQLGPNVSVSGSLYQSNGNRFIQQEGKVVNATVNGMQAGLNINQPIFNGLSLLNVARANGLLMDAQMELVNRTEQDVINLVSVRFLQVLLDQELVKIAEENLNLQKTQYEQVKAQVELGARSPVDEYNQQAQVSNAEMRLQQATATLVNDRVTLLQTLMVDPASKVTIVEPDWDINAIAINSQSLEDLLATSVQRRSDLRQARLQEKSARLSLWAAKGNYLPGLNAFYNNGSAWNQVKGADRTDPAFRTFDQQFWTDNRSNSFGLSLNVPIFTGFQNRFFHVQSKVFYENAKLTTKSRELTVRGDVVTAYENFLSFQQAYKAGVTGLEASQMAFRLEQERYNLGVTSFVDFANANRTYVQAQTDMAQAKYRILFQKILIDYAAGTLKPEDLPQ
jgi:outer membrane protein